MREGEVGREKERDGALINILLLLLLLLFLCRVAAVLNFTALLRRKCRVSWKGDVSSD